MKTKVCKRCGVEKSVEFFSKNRAAKDGLINSCKPCETKRVAAWAAANPEKVKAWEEKNRAANLRASLPQGYTQACKTCGIEKPASEYTANPRAKNNLRRICKSCTSDRMRSKYLANPDIQRAKTSAWRKNNPERYKAYESIYQERNRTERNEYRRQIRLKNIDREKEKDRRYLRENRAKVYAKNARRRAAETRATPGWLNAVQKAQIQEFYEIALAKSVQTGIPHAVDHIVPLKGTLVRGLHVPWNLQVLTKIENSIKHNKMLEAY